MTGVLLPSGWKTPVGYSNGIAVRPGRIVFVAGQVGWDAAQIFRSAELAPQFDQALENVLAVVAEAGGGPEHICRVTAFCTDKPGYLAARPEPYLASAGGPPFPRYEHDLRVGPTRRVRQDRA